MQKKIYVAPCAEHVMLAPAEPVSSWTWQWQWGKSQFAGNPSIQGTIPVWADPWNYNGTDPISTE